VSAFGLGKSTRGTGFIIPRLTLVDKISGVTNVAGLKSLLSALYNLVCACESIPSC
jgi:hypothetical protein